MNNNEDFVSYDLAMRLKQEGFNYPTLYGYSQKMRIEPDVSFGNIKEVHSKSPKNYNDNRKGLANGVEFCSAPTLAQAQKWLREVKGIHIAVIGNYDCGGTLCAFEVWLQGVSGGRQVLQYETKRLSDHESALSAGIEAALKLIEEGER